MSTSGGTSGGGGTPSGPASGDLAGTYPSPTVANINTSPLGTTTGATTGQALTWNGTAWVPVTPTLSGTAGGDLSGTYPNPAVAKINGSPLGTTTGATTGQALVYSGTNWAPSTITATGTASGDLSGTYPGPTVAQINGSPLGTTTGAGRNAVLTWNGSAWAPSALAYTDTWTPNAQTLQAWTTDPATATYSAVVPTIGVEYVTGIYLPAGATATNLLVYVQTAGAGLSNCYLTLRNSNGVLVAQTADQSTNFATAQIVTAALTGGPWTLSQGTYYVGILIGSGSTTSPKFALASGYSAVPNMGGSATASGSFGTGNRCLNIGSALTSPPANITGLTPAKNGNIWLVCVN